jgi:hypothetical protein
MYFVAPLAESLFRYKTGGPPSQGQKSSSPPTVAIATHDDAARNFIFIPYFPSSLFAVSSPNTVGGSPLGF